LRDLLLYVPLTLLICPSTDKKGLSPVFYDRSIEEIGTPLQRFVHTISKSTIDQVQPTFNQLLPSSNLAKESHIDQIMLLLRFMKRERVDSFLRGDLYLNTLEYFAGLEGDPVRADVHEGAQFAFQVATIEIEDEKGEFIPLKRFINPVTHRELKPSGMNLLSMYFIKTVGGFRVDERNFAFGQTAIVITRPDEFFARVQRALKNAGRRVGWRPVEYVPRSYEGPVGPFRKFDDFEYQHEIRLVVTGGSGEPLQLAIGDISDICEAHPASHFRLGYVSGVSEHCP
jgi:hypothetical protein